MTFRIANAKDDAFIDGGLCVLASIVNEIEENLFDGSRLSCHGVMCNGLLYIDNQLHLAIGCAFLQSRLEA
ncbi:MAG: hypothetical protein R3C56_21005 [Pirellulaceae bacterium]